MSEFWRTLESEGAPLVEPDAANPGWSIVSFVARGASEDPDDVVVSGTSRRGMVAALLALEHPDVFGNVLSLSGSYYWSPADVAAYEWVPRRYAEAERRPVDFYVAAGELETVVMPRNRGHYLLATNRHMRDVLVARATTWSTWSSMESTAS